MDYNQSYKKIINDCYKSRIENVGKEIITLFTPTYNRSNFLHRLSACLAAQTSNNFVWIIVNDGSQDKTGEVVAELMKKEQLPIMYIDKPNGGKHTAFKCALKECETIYFQCMDDDDLYDSNAVDFFISKWKEVKKQKLDYVGAIRTLARRPDGTYKTNFSIDESNYGKEYVTTTLENNYVKGLIQENWTCYETSKLRSIDLFPTDYWMFEEHKFLSEGIWQSRFARRYSCLYVFIALREYHEDAATSLMRQVKTRQFYIDRFINSKISLDEQFDYISKSWKNLIKQCITLNWVRSYLKINFSDLLNHTELNILKCLYIMVYPTSFLSRWYCEKIIK